MASPGPFPVCLSPPFFFFYPLVGTTPSFNRCAIPLSSFSLVRPALSFRLACADIFGPGFPIRLDPPGQFGVIAGVAFPTSPEQFFLSRRSHLFWVAVNSADALRLIFPFACYRLLVDEVLLIFTSV